MVVAIIKKGERPSDSVAKSHHIDKKLPRLDAKKYCAVMKIGEGPLSYQKRIREPLNKPAFTPSPCGRGRG